MQVQFKKTNEADICPGKLGNRVPLAPLEIVSTPVCRQILFPVYAQRKPNLNVTVTINCSL
jgi:hypothetical protein